MRFLVLVSALAFFPLSLASASYRSAHFVVDAPTPEVAAQVAKAAEQHLCDLSRQWLGKPISEWSEPCPITVTLAADGSRGCTSFVFTDGKVARQEMHLEGTVERILQGVLPHEITHVILTQHFRRPVPRWADEGGAALGEGKFETTRYRQQMHQLLAMPDRRIPLRSLFGLSQYPRDAFAFYETGISVSNYLVNLKDRRTFLQFIAEAMDGDWDAAVKRHYGFQSVEELEQKWLDRLSHDGPRERTAEQSAAPEPVGRPRVATETSRSAP